jgi:methionyl-tRNA formyltransferase
VAKILVEKGAELMSDIIPKWFKGKIVPREQDHAKASFTKKIVKDDGLMDLSGDPYKNFLKWNAYKGWPGSYFFRDYNGKKTRVTITEATYEEGKFIIKKVIQEGKKETAWKE